MSYYKRRIFSQNFLHNPDLVAKLLDEAHFARSDTVVEIGPGKGIITEILSKRVEKVIAFEIDPLLTGTLKKRFAGNPHIEIVYKDIRQALLPQSQYKVFSNVPFNLSGEIMYKLLFYSFPPEESFLIMQKEAAQRYVGSPKETTFSLLTKPWFDLGIEYHFKRGDFSPKPNTDIVLVHIKKWRESLIREEDEQLYKGFIKYAFGTWKKNLKLGLRPLFSYEQWVRLAKDNQFSVHAKPTDLTFDQWLALFTYLQRGVTEEKKQTLY